MSTIIRHYAIGVHAPRSVCDRFSNAIQSLSDNGILHDSQVIDEDECGLTVLVVGPGAINRIVAVLEQASQVEKDVKRHEAAPWWVDLAFCLTGVFALVVMAIVGVLLVQ